jgi:hypothetical protein
MAHGKWYSKTVGPGSSATPTCVCGGGWSSLCFFYGGFLHWTTDFVSFYVGLGREFLPKANMECIFFIASPVLTGSIGAVIVYAFVLCPVTAFWWPGGSRALWLDACRLARFALFALRGCLVRSPKQTNKQTCEKFSRQPESGNNPRELPKFEKKRYRAQNLTKKFLKTTHSLENYWSGGISRQSSLPSRLRSKSL